jgi:hypothetical protein
MVSQLFKKNIPIELLFSLLDKICIKTDKYYLIDLNAYKKLIFYNYHPDFCKSIIDYYFTGKQFYIERKLTYNSFTNIIRQICKHSNVMYTSQIKYNESKYNIDYLIFF